MAWTQRINDTFTDTALTALTSHTPNQGGAWSFITGHLRIDAGGTALDADTLDGSQYAIAKNAQALGNDQAAEMTITTSGSGWRSAHLRAAGSDAASLTCYEFVSNGNPTNGLGYIRRRDTGVSYTILTSGSVVWDNNDVLRAEAVSDSLTLFQNGSSVLNTSDSTYTSGVAGIMRAVTTGVEVDQFKAYEDVPAPATTYHLYSNRFGRRGWVR